MSIFIKRYKALFIFVFILLGLVGIGYLAAQSQPPAGDDYASALALYNTGQYGPAIASLQGFIQAHPQDSQVPEARYRLALAYYQSGQYGPFEQTAEAFETDYPGNPRLGELAFCRALVPYKQSDWEKAAGALLAFSSAHPDSPLLGEADYYAAVSLFNLGRYDDFKALAESYSSANPQGSHLGDLSYLQAQASFRQGRWSDARQALTKLMADNPGSAQIASIKQDAALCLYNLGDYEGFRREAQALLEQYGAVPALSQPLRSYLAVVDFTQEHWAVAREQFLKIVADYPNLPQIPWMRYYAARCLYGQADYDGFRREAQAVLQQYPSADPEIIRQLRSHLAVADFTQEHWSQGRAQLTQFIADYPNLPQIPWMRYYAARCLYGQTDYDGFRREAQALLQQYPSADPEIIRQLRAHLATASFIQERWAEARVLAEKFLADYSNPDQTLPLKQNAALCLYHLGDYAGFQREAEAFLSQNPSAPEALVQALRTHLAMVPYQKRQWEAAVSQLGLVASEPAADPQILGGIKLYYGDAMLRQADALRGAGQREQAGQLSATAKGLLRDFRQKAQAALGRDYPDSLKENLEAMLYESYYFEQDWPGLLQLAQDNAAKNASPSLRWARAQLWEGITRTMTSPPDWAGAAAALDAILNAKVIDPSTKDHLPTEAAYWRAVVAQQMGDRAGLRASVLKIRNEMPEGKQKRRALARFGGILLWE